jgi:hypothetical protein
MTANRSVATDTMLPHIVCPDVAEAIDWLTKTFAVAERCRYDEPGGPEHSMTGLGLIGQVLD